MGIVQTTIPTIMFLMMIEFLPTGRIEEMREDREPREKAIKADRRYIKWA